jgi:hypothetical protein
MSVRNYTPHNCVVPGVRGFYVAGWCVSRTMPPLPPSNESRGSCYDSGLSPTLPYPLLLVLHPRDPARTAHAAPVVTKTPDAWADASHGPALVAHFAGAGTVSVTVCPVKMLSAGSANSISTLCWPGGSPTTTIVLLSLKSLPRQVVDGYMQMPDPRRYVEGARPEHR